MEKSSGTNWKRLENVKDVDIDTSDIPELSKEFFTNAVWRSPGKQSVTIRIDSDVLEWLKSQGKGYQTRINNLLRKFMEANL